MFFHYNNQQNLNNIVWIIILFDINLLVVYISKEDIDRGYIIADGIEEIDIEECLSNYHIISVFEGYATYCFSTKQQSCDPLKSKVQDDDAKYQQDKQCFTQCTDEYAYPEAEDNYICDNKCQYYEKIITNQDSSGITKEKHCMSECTGEYPYQYVNTRNICVQKCSQTDQKFIENQKQCAFECQNIYWYLQDNQQFCIQQKSCNITVNEKLLEQYDYDTKECIQYSDCEQQNYIYVIKVQDEECVRFSQKEQCKELQNVETFKQYIKQLSKTESKQCVSSCPKYYYEEDQQQICVDNCQTVNMNGLGLDNNYCLLIKDCQQIDYHIMITKNDSHECYYSSNITDCQQYASIEYNSSKVFAQYKYKQDNQCVEICTEQYAEPLEGYICSDSCMYDEINEIKQCVESCVFKFEVQDENRKYCVSDCSKEEVYSIQEDQTCVANCKNKYWYEDEKEKKICTGKQQCDGVTVNNIKYSSVDSMLSQCISQEECERIGEAVFHGYINKTTCIAFLQVQKCRQIDIYEEFNIHLNIQAVQPFLCVEECEQNQVWYYDSLQKRCLTSCQSSDTNQVLLSGMNIRTKECRQLEDCQKYYHIEDQEVFDIRCIYIDTAISCQDFTQYDKTKDYLYNYGTQCYSNCTESQTHIYSQEYQCVKECTEEYAQQNDNVCNKTYLYIEIYIKICVDNCTDLYELTVQAERQYCASSCSEIEKYEYQYDNSCVQQCQYYWFYYDEEKKYCTQENTCQNVVNKNQESYHLLSIEQKQCVHQCKTLYWYKNDQNEDICINSCEQLNMNSYQIQTYQCATQDYCQQFYHVFLYLQNDQTKQICIYTTIKSCEVFSQKQETQNLTILKEDDQQCTDCNIEGYKIKETKQETICRKDKHKQRLTIGLSVGISLLVIIIIVIVVVLIVKKKAQMNQNQKNVKLRNIVDEDSDDF